MKVGIIGPSQIVAKANQVIKKEFPQIELVDYIYSIYTETPTILKNHQFEVDALFFTGKTPYTLAGIFIKPTVPWEYVPRSGSSMLRILLYAKLWTPYDICSVSFDTYNEDLLYEAYHEIGIPRDQLKIYIAEEQVLASKNYQTTLCDFHKKNYYENHVSCCITGLQGAYDELRASGVPCLLLEPTANIIRETLYKLQLKYLVKESKQSQLVAICIQIDAPNDHSLFTENDYQDALNRMKVSEQVYLFAQRIQAAVIETGDKNYLLFSTMQLLENETNNLKAIELLQTVKNNSSSTVSIGIGYGKTANEAKSGANRGMLHASKKGGDLAFIVYEGNKIIGPLANITQHKEEPGPIIDEKFLSVSEKVGVSINTVFKLYCITEQYKKTDFTIKELASLFGVTTRTMNRIIKKFALNGFCTIIGKRVIGNFGRPSRIIHLNLG